MTVESGYANKILRVDLSSRKITNIPTELYADRFIGGRGIAAKIYWDEVSTSIKAFDAENRLIFITGPLAGFPSLSGSRLQICGKSPATTPELFCYANLGGSFGAELKFSGWDGIVVQGKSDKPIYLFINDSNVEIRDGSALWGKDNVETREILKENLGNSVKVLATGIAGQNMVPFSTVLAEDDSAGTGGFAAVMGSKKLKAIAVQGSHKVVPANPEKLHELTNYVRNMTKDRRITPPTVQGFPVPVKSQRKACYGCIAGCLRAVYEGSNGEKGKFTCQQSAAYLDATLEYYKEWTEVPFYAARLCDRYGLDTMVMEPLTKWLHRCEQAGILTDAQTGIPLTEYGNLNFIETLIKKISLKEGFGDVLAQGIMKAADAVGGGSKELLGDLAFPRTGEEWVYDPRMFITTGLFYAMEPKRPIQHLHEISWPVAHWVAWLNGAENAYVSTDVIRSLAKKFWGSEIAADFSTYEGKALAGKKIQDRQYVKESLILCDYAWPMAHSKYSDNHHGDSSIESKILSVVTGKDIDEEALYKIGEKNFNLQRAILTREGHGSKETDVLPEFSYTIPLQKTEHNPDCLLPGKDGEKISRKGEVVDRDKFESMRDEYYGYRGWDVANGRQTVKQLEGIGLADIARELKTLGLVK
ncbi:aldehyde ferredoxin oxidoreductase N-terminal domain-containing protein [Chloroflexota bacterium]